jgi:hypothetical protein
LFACERGLSARADPVDQRPGARDQGVVRAYQARKMLHGDKAIMTSARIFAALG